MQPGPDLERLICGLWGDKQVHFYLKMLSAPSVSCKGTSQWFSQEKEQLLCPGHSLFQGSVSGSTNPEYFNADTRSEQPGQALFLPRNADLCRKSLPGPDISSILALCSLLKIHSSRVLSGAGARKSQRVQSVSQPRGKKTPNPAQTLHFIAIENILRQIYIKPL